MLHSRAEAYILLSTLGALGRLLHHLQHFSEAADLLIEGYAALGLEFNERSIRLGEAVHDAGKILHPNELVGPGSLYEPTGKTLLLQHGVQAEVAQCCISHAAWRTAGLSLEELSVALADKLWKGNRVDDLELLVIDQAASRLGVDRWEVFQTLDSLFEAVAAGGPNRLERSK